MGSRNKVIVFAVVGFLCVAAAALAFAGEGTKIKESETIETSSGCIYLRRSPANALGYTAVVLLLIAQITISAVARCACCSRSTSNSACAIICFVISWVASAIGICIIVNASHITTFQQQKLDDKIDDCIYVQTGLFSAGGALGLVACALGLYAYHSSPTSSLHPAPATAAAPVAMGYPQFDNNNAASSYPYSKQQQQQPYAV